MKPLVQAVSTSESAAGKKKFVQLRKFTDKVRKDLHMLDRVLDQQQ